MFGGWLLFVVYCFVFARCCYVLLCCSCVVCSCCYAFVVAGLFVLFVVTCGVYFVGCCLMCVLFRMSVSGLLCVVFPCSIV